MFFHGPEHWNLHFFDLRNVANIRKWRYKNCLLLLLFLLLLCTCTLKIHNSIEHSINSIESMTELWLKSFSFKFSEFYRQKNLIFAGEPIKKA